MVNPLNNGSLNRLLDEVYEFAHKWHRGEVALRKAKDSEGGTLYYIIDIERDD